MAVICSQAFPAMGRIMSPKKRSFRPDFLLTSSTAPVNNLQRSVNLCRGLLTAMLNTCKLQEMDLPCDNFKFAHGKEREKSVEQGI